MTDDALTKRLIDMVGALEETIREDRDARRAEREREVERQEARREREVARHEATMEILRQLNAGHAALAAKIDAVPSSLLRGVGDAIMEHERREAGGATMPAALREFMERTDPGSPIARRARASAPKEDCGETRPPRGLAASLRQLPTAAWVALAVAVALALLGGFLTHALTVNVNYGHQPAAQQERSEHHVAPAPAAAPPP